MTNDELLNEICLYYSNGDMPGSDRLVSALRAVVELHKPDFQGSCDYCYQRDTSQYDYPCPTIRAIEKELK